MNANVPSGGRGERFTPRILLLLGGLLVWATHFLVVYIFAALACARAFADIRLLGIGIVPLATAAATLAALLVLGWLMRRVRREEGRAATVDPRTPRFMRGMGLAIAVYSVGAVLLQTLPVLMIPVCR